MVTLVCRDEFGHTLRLSQDTWGVAISRAYLLLKVEPVRAALQKVLRVIAGPTEGRRRD